MPSSTGSNVFAQKAPSGTLYAFPPFSVIAPRIRLFIEWGCVDVALFLPVHSVASAWMALLEPCVLGSVALAPAAGALMYPSSSGYFGNLLLLPFGLTAYLCRFPPCLSPPRSLPDRPLKVLVLSDFMLCPLRSVSWPPPLRVIIHGFSGAT